MGARPPRRDRATAILVCASARLSAQNIAFSAVARASIINDEHFAGGDYYATGASPGVGLAVARMMAHITYVSEESLRHKFGRDRIGDSPTFDVDFQVESYLEHQGQSFLDRFDANSYLYLTRVMDYFDPFADEDGRGRAAAPGAARGSSSSRSTPTGASRRQHSAEIARVLARAGCAVNQEEVVSPWGHDSFLLEVPRYHELVAAQLADSSSLVLVK